MTTKSLTELGLSSADLTAIGKLSEKGLSPEDIADGIDKIHSIQSSASEIERATKGDFNNSVQVDTAVEETRIGLDLHHKAGQGATPILAMAIHNYTDGNTLQLDNVGSGDILRLKNAFNPINRPDKGENYTGDGKFLVFENNLGEVLRVFNNGEWVYDKVPLKFTQIKPDDGKYAFEFSASDHVKLLNLDNLLLMWVGATSVTMKFAKSPLYQIENVNVMKILKDGVYLYEKLELAKGIKDKTGSTGTLGQVLTANGDGTCQWKTI